MKHLGYALIGGFLFFIATWLTLRLTDAGIQPDGPFGFFAFAGLLRIILISTTWLGVVVGGLSSVALRKSENRSTYVWITMIFILIFTEFVVSTIY